MRQRQKLASTANSIGQPSVSTGRGVQKQYGVSDGTPETTSRGEAFSSFLHSCREKELQFWSRVAMSHRRRQGYFSILGTLLLKALPKIISNIKMQSHPLFSIIITI